MSGIAMFCYRQALRAALERIWSHVPGSEAWFVGDRAMDAYVCAMTPGTTDPVSNYECYEILGDAAVNKSVTWYFYDRYPQLRCARGVRYLARLKINTIGKEQLSRWTCQLGLDAHIRADTSQWTAAHRMGVLEDVFEAFVGVTEMRVDEVAGRRGAGYSAVYSLVARLLDPIPFVLTYEALWDPKTRLKEYFDARPGHRLVYRHTERDGRFAAEVLVDGRVVSCSDYKTAFHRRIDAEQAAADRALTSLRAG
jgi:dsRNA-specific ribonuclease